MFSVAEAEFHLDVNDYPARDGSGDAVTEVTGFFCPPAGNSPDIRSGEDGEPDLVGIAVLGLPAGTPGAQAAWQAFRNPAGPAAIGHAMRTAILACPCTFPAGDCAALNADILRQAIEQAAALRPNGQAGR